MKYYYSNKYWNIYKEDDEGKIYICGSSSFEDSPFHRHDKLASDAMEFNLISWYSRWGDLMCKTKIYNRHLIYPLKEILLFEANK